MQQRVSGISEQLQLHIHSCFKRFVFFRNHSFSLLRKLSGFGHIFIPVVILWSHNKSNKKMKQKEQTKKTFESII